MRRSTVIVVVVFVALLGLAWYLQQNPLNSAESAANTPLPTLPGPLWQLTLEQVTRLELTPAVGERLVLEQVEGIWSVLEPQPGLADNQLVASTLAALLNLRPLAVLDTPPGLEAMGLQAPAYYLLIELQSGQQQRLELGNLTVTGSGYYARLNGGAAVVVSQYNFTALLSWLSEPPLLPQPTAMPEAEPTSVP